MLPGWRDSALKNARLSSTSEDPHATTAVLVDATIRIGGRGIGGRGIGGRGISGRGIGGRGIGGRGIDGEEFPAKEKTHARASETSKMRS